MLDYKKNLIGKEAATLVITIIIMSVCMQIFSRNLDHSLSSVKAATTPHKVTGVTAKNKNGKIKLKWNKQKNITGYQVVYTTSHDFKTDVLKKTVKNRQMYKMTLKNLKANTSYSIKIRAYKKINNKNIWGPYSRIIACTTIKYHKAKKFNIVAEYKGRVYCGLESENSIHIGAPGEKTMFCIDNGYVYYYSFEKQLLLAPYHTNNTSFYREKIDGSDKKLLFTIYSNGYQYSLQDVYLCDGAIYYSYLSQDTDYGSLEYYDFNYGFNEVLFTSPSNYVKINNDYAQLECVDNNNNIYMSGPYGGLLAYNVKDKTITNLDCPGYVNRVMVNGNNVYYSIQNYTYKYNINSKKTSDIKNIRLSYIHDNVGYYTEEGLIFGMNLSNQKSKIIVKRAFEAYYNEIYLVTDKYIYATDIGQIDDDCLVQINKKNYEIKQVGYAEVIN